MGHFGHDDNNQENARDIVAQFSFDRSRCQLGARRFRWAGDHPDRGWRTGVLHLEREDGLVTAVRDDSVR